MEKFLAWTVIALFFSFVVVPVVAGWMSDDKFVSYKEVWIGGHALLLVLASVFGIVAAIVWALSEVGLL